MDPTAGEVMPKYDPIRGYAAASAVNPYLLHNQQAYERLMRQIQANPGHPVFATAYGGTFVATPRPAAREVKADVVVESSAIRKPKAFRRDRWAMFLTLSVLSIWPAWASPIARFVASVNTGQAWHDGPAGLGVDLALAGVLFVFVMLSIRCSKEES